MVDARIARHAEMLENRVRKNLRSLEGWARKENVTAYRLYDRDIPEVPLHVDRYGERLHLSRYLPRAGSDPRRTPEWLDAMAEAAARATGLGQVYAKDRQRGEGGTQYGRFADRAEALVVEEAGLKFRVNLSDYVDTGLFLDHRTTRAWVREAARGKRMLNLFAYTGSFTVYAAAGGAAASTSVDLSNTYLDWARENLRLNGLDEARHRRVRTDVVRFLRDGAAAGERFDLIVLDPPSFSKSKGMEGDFDVQRDHARLVHAALALLAPGGTLYFSTNRRGFTLAVSPPTGVGVVDVTRESLPPDFRDPETHRLWRFVRP